MTSQILTEVHAIDAQKLEECIQKCPAGILSFFCLCCYDIQSKFVRIALDPLCHYFVSSSSLFDLTSIILLPSTSLFICCKTFE